MFSLRSSQSWVLMYISAQLFLEKFFLWTTYLYNWCDLNANISPWTQVFEHLAPRWKGCFTKLWKFYKVGPWSGKQITEGWDLWFISGQHGFLFVLYFLAVEVNNSPLLWSSLLCHERLYFLETEIKINPSLLKLLSRYLVTARRKLYDTIS